MENTALQPPYVFLSFQMQENIFQGLLFPLLLHNVQLLERGISLLLSPCH